MRANMMIIIMIIIFCNPCEDQAMDDGCEQNDRPLFAS